MKIQKSIDGKPDTKKHGKIIFYKKKKTIFKNIYSINSREAIKEDDDGLIEGTIADIIQKAKRKRQALKRGHNRLGMMRHVFIIADCSEAMSVQDLKPTRMLCSIKVLYIFIII